MSLLAICVFLYWCFYFSPLPSVMSKRTQRVKLGLRNRDWAPEVVKERIYSIDQMGEPGSIAAAAPSLVRSSNAAYHCPSIQGSFEACVGHCCYGNHRVMWGHGLRKLLLTAPFLLSHLSPCFIFLPSCSLYFYPELCSLHLCSHPGVTRSGRGNGLFGWSLSVTGIFQGCPFALYFSGPLCGYRCSNWRKSGQSTA